MRRRSFLAMLGAAPLAAVAPSAPASPLRVQAGRQIAGLTLVASGPGVQSAFAVRAGAVRIHSGSVVARVTTLESAVASLNGPVRV